MDPDLGFMLALPWARPGAEYSCIITHILGLMAISGQPQKTLLRAGFLF